MPKPITIQPAMKTGSDGESASAICPAAICTALAMRTGRPPWR